MVRTRRFIVVAACVFGFCMNSHPAGAQAVPLLEEPRSIGTDEADLILAKLALVKAKNAYALARADKHREFETSAALKDAQYLIAQCAREVVQARANLLAALATNPAYSTLVQQEKAAQKKVDALKQDNAPQGQIAAAAQEVLQIGGTAGLMQRRAEALDAPLIAATQRLADANSALSRLKEAAESDGDLETFRTNVDVAAAAVEAARKQLVADTGSPGADSAPVSPLALSNLPPGATYVDIHEVVTADKIAQAAARAQFENSNTAYTRALATRRQEMERSPEFQDAQRNVSLCTRDLAAARVAVLAALSINPAYAKLREAEAAAERNLATLQHNGGLREEIAGASDEIFRLGARTSAMERAAEQADEAFTQATQKLLNANRALTTLKDKTAYTLVIDPDLKSLKEARDNASVALTDATNQLQTDDIRIVRPHYLWTTVPLPVFYTVDSQGRPHVMSLR